MSETPTSKTAGTAIGLLFVAIGALIGWMVLADPSAARAPLWVVEAAAGCFVCAGASVVARALGAELAARLLALAVVYLLAVPGLWLLAGDGGSCSVGVAIGATAARGTADPGLCRVVFGTGGIVTLGIAVLFTWSFVRGRRGAPDGSPPPDAQ